MSKDFNQYQPVVLKTVLKKSKIFCKFSQKKHIIPYKHQIETRTENNTNIRRIKREINIYLLKS
jgi:hypothetical protein